MTTGQSDGPSGTGKPSTDHQEIEWQFDAGDLEPVEAWLDGYSGSSRLVVAPASTVEITDTYYDTDDWRFYRAGYALRVRETDGEVEATMKSLAPAEDGLRRRREISEPLEEDSPATLKRARGSVGERSRALLGEHELRRLFRIQTRRQRFAIESSTEGDMDGVRRGEISLDASEVEPGKEASRLKRVEVEVGEDPTPELRAFVDEMQSALDLTPTSISKYEMGLYAAGLDPEARGTQPATDSEETLR